MLHSKCCVVQSMIAQSSDSICSFETTGDDHVLRSNYTHSADATRTADRASKHAANKSGPTRRFARCGKTRARARSTPGCLSVRITRPHPAAFDRIAWTPSYAAHRGMSCTRERRLVCTCSAVMSALDASMSVSRGHQTPSLYHDLSTEGWAVTRLAAAKDARGR
jgi:hypothetical protein